MHKVWVVVRREYMDRVKKKSFWIGTVIFPLLFGVLMFGSIFLVDLKTGEQRTLAILDETGRVAEPMRDDLQEHKLKDGSQEYIVEIVEVRDGLEATRKALEPRATDGDLFGIVTIGNDLQAADNFAFYGRNVSNISTIRTVRSALRDAVIGLRLERSELEVDRETLDRINAPVRFSSFQLTDSGEVKEKDFGQAYIGTIVFVMVLYMALILYGVAVMRGILEEKSTRVMEVLLGSLTPTQLMTGKIVGIGLVGLTQVAVYAMTAVVARAFATAALVGGDIAGIMDTFNPVTMFYFIVFFVLGYFFYTSLFAAAGAVCNSEQEAQNLQGPVIICLVIPMASTIFFVSNPDSTIAVIVSMIPMFTPMVMFMRISVVTPPLWQILLSILITSGTIWLLMRGVAKIFRIGILMYGKRPSLPEIFRWARS